MKLNDLGKLNIVILGIGREGIDTLRFLRKQFPQKNIGIADKQEFRNLPIGTRKIIIAGKRLNLHFGKKYLSFLKNYSAVIKSPGIAFKVIKPFIGRNQKLTSQTEIFLENCKGMIIGITGTKGKSTTATLIYRTLKNGGLKAHLVGNIGEPVLGHLLNTNKDDIFVYELSSHQLMNLHKSPHIAVFLNIFREHLDYYKSFNEYIRAKENITVHQNSRDFLVYNSTDKRVVRIAEKSPAKKIPFKGEYYTADFEAAKAVARLCRIPESVIEKTVKGFKKLPHRLEFAGEYKGIKFYNDSLATIPEAAIFAIRALGKDVETVFLGGHERYYDFTGLAKEVLKGDVKTVILFPPTGRKIWKKIVSLKKTKVPKHFFVENMEDAVKLAYQNTSKGKICLLSCASPSFGIFKDYKERGDLFKKYVKIYGKR
ncbi:MAG: Mur ligase family protein [Candidatus Parcubacteria bacterium]|nr:Mur ligase family protein [Candidatus Parcubacteria bacterium]